MANQVYRRPGKGQQDDEAWRQQQAQAQGRADAIRQQAEENMPYYEEYDNVRKPKRKKKTVKPEKYRTPEQRARKGCLIVFLSAVLVVAIALGVLFLMVRHEINGGGATATEAVEINVPPHAGANTVGGILKENGLIDNPIVFRFYIKFNDLAPLFQTGDFVIPPGSSYDEIVKIISQAPNTARETFDIRVPEGVTVRQIANLFAETGITTAEEFLEVANDWERFSDLRLVQELQADPVVQSTESLYEDRVFELSEGYLFPDTYQFFKDQTVEEIVHILYENMDKQITDEMYARMDELNITVREAITLASVIEAESGGHGEEAKVSGVFWNRLNGKKEDGGRALGSDVTIDYVKIMLQWTQPDPYMDIPRPEISYEETREAVGASRFYDYVTEDSDSESTIMPIGPINSISLVSLNAALYPEEHEYCYFVTDDYFNFYYAYYYAWPGPDGSPSMLDNINTADAMNVQFEQEQAAAAAEQGEGEGENGEGG